MNNDMLMLAAALVGPGTVFQNKGGDEYRVEGVDPGGSDRWWCVFAGTGRAGSARSDGGGGLFSTEDILA
jgi:hypothetical protein